MLKEILKERKLPPLKTRNEMLDILQKEVFGYMPSKPDKVSFQVTEDYIELFCAGKAISKKVDITAQMGDKEFSFPCYVSIPKKEGKHPFFVCVNFRDNLPDIFLPVEEIIDNGFAVLSFCYNDVTKDNSDFTDGLAGVLLEDGLRTETSPGKIAMWSWAAQRVMDYACTLECLDKKKSVMCGHSRLGKTALLTAATDERFKFAYSNNSGCSGAALSRGNKGERIKNICTNFPYWFCEKYKMYIDNEENMPFDQHYLAAVIAPRHLYVASARGDYWADPDSEMLTCVAASEAYEEYGKKGFICEDRLPAVGDVFHEGNIGYHMRDGLHYMGREDWANIMQFVKKHI